MSAINWTSTLPPNWSASSYKSYYILVRGSNSEPLEMSRVGEGTLAFYKKWDENSPNTVAWAPAEEVLAAIGAPAENTADIQAKLYEANQTIKHQEQMVREALQTLRAILP